jgi:hypothetical protein
MAPGSVIQKLVRLKDGSPGPLVVFERDAVSGMSPEALKHRLENTGHFDLILHSKINKKSRTKAWLAGETIRVQTMAVPGVVVRIFTDFAHFLHGNPVRVEDMGQGFGCMR